MQPGIYPDISNEAYHIGPGTSKTDLKFILRSPATYRAIKNGDVEKKQTVFKDLGKALHELVLEPEVFRKTYCKPLTIEAAERQGIKVLDDKDKILAMVEDQNRELRAILAASGMIQDTEQLVDLITQMNAGRSPKLSTTGNKADLIARIMEETAQGEEHVDSQNYGELSAMKGPELKAILEQMNEKREGFLSTSGSKSDLLARYRENGGDLGTVWEWIEQTETETGMPYLLGSGKNRTEMIEWLNAHEYKGGNWRSWDMVKQEWADNNPDRIVLSEEDWTKVQGMHAALMAHPWACKLLWPKKGGKAEQTVYWVDEETGELCKCRPDFLRYDNRPVDLKSCNDATPEGFKKSVEAYGYDLQEQYYLDGLEAVTGTRPPNMPFVVVEPEYPHLVAVYVLGVDYAKIGKGLARKALNLLKTCRDLNNWPGLPETIEVLEPRRFYQMNHDEFLDWE